MTIAMAPATDVELTLQLSAEPAVTTQAWTAPKLSQREIEVLVNWLRSDSKSELAARMYITTSTISTHLGRVRDKYAAAGRPANTKSALLVRALQDGLITIDEL